MAIVYPENGHQTDSETIFFIGHANDYAFINGRDIELVHEGNFCPIFKLNPGKNIFVVDVDDNTRKYLIERVAKEEKTPDEFKAYDGKEVATQFSKICLDAGHGGEADGTISPKGLKEKDLNLYLVAVIAEALEKAGFEVVLTRQEDQDLSLEKRVEISQENNCDLFLSIHHNAIPDNLDPKEHRGISAHYYYDHSLSLAKELSAHLAQNLGLNDNGAIQQDLYVTRENKSSMAVLLECGYLIHPEESELISSKEFQESLASNLASFLSKFIKNSN